MLHAGLVMVKLVDNDNPAVSRKAAELVEGATTDEEKLRRLFAFVRDEIEFGFPPEGDAIKASKTLERGYGQCNTKGILFAALCRAVGLEARVHYSDISKEIQRGFFRGLTYWLMPKHICHSWVEVRIDGKWYRIDSYINDLALHKGSVRELHRRGWKTGFSVSREGAEPSAELILDEAHFSQMGAVTGEHGVIEPEEFLAGPDYHNAVGPFKTMVYRLTLPFVNRRVRRMRELGRALM